MPRWLVTLVDLIRAALIGATIALMLWAGWALYQSAAGVHHP